MFISGRLAYCQHHSPLIKWSQFRLPAILRGLFWWKIIPLYIRTGRLCFSVFYRVLSCDVPYSEKTHALCSPQIWEDASTVPVFFFMVHKNFLHYKTLDSKSLLTVEVKRKIQYMRYLYLYVHVYVEENLLMPQQTDCTLKIRFLRINVYLIYFKINLHREGLYSARSNKKIYNLGLSYQASMAVHARS
jgi:hypothetical protein